MCQIVTPGHLPAEDRGRQRLVQVARLAVEDVAVALGRRHARHQVHQPAAGQRQRSGPPRRTRSGRRAPARPDRPPAAPAPGPGAPCACATRLAFQQPWPVSASGPLAGQLPFDLKWLTTTVKALAASRPPGRSAPGAAGRRAGCRLRWTSGSSAARRRGVDGRRPVDQADPDRVRRRARAA